MRLVTKVALIAGVAVAAGAAYWLFDSNTSRDTAVTIPDRAFAGFDKCQPSKEFVAIMDDLFAHHRPIAKENGAWVFAVRGRFMDMEIRRLELGVCNPSGERGCGWSFYTGLGMDSPKETARTTLKAKTGIDFTEAQRDDESDATMRPLLSARPNSTTSLLYCDSGAL